MTETSNRWRTLLAAGATTLAAVAFPLIATSTPASAEPQHKAAASCPADQHYGQTGTCVKQLQEQLRGVGFKLEADGVFGPQTQADVLSFQSTRGLSVDGDAGPKTKEALAAKKKATQKTSRTAEAAIRALQNADGKACGTNSEGGKGFNTSCTGNGGQPEYWCSDYVGWVWDHSGNSASGVSAWAPTIETYGSKHGTKHTSASYVPKVGDAISYADSEAVQHVGIVAAMNGPEDQAVIISGDTHGSGNTQAEYASTSKVWVDIAGSGSWQIGMSPDYTKNTISSYVTPVAG